MPRIAISFAVVVSVLLWTLPAVAQTTFPLYCRGPLSYVTGSGAGFTTIFFTKNRTPAGSQGALLAEGTCSWPDRVVSSSEPSQLLIVEYKVSGLGDASTSALIAMVPAFINCNHDHRCTFMLRVYNDTRGHFQEPTGNIFVYFPFQ